MGYLECINITLFRFQVLMDFIDIFVLLIFNLISLESESILCIMANLLSETYFVTQMWSVLVRVPYYLEKNVYFVLIW